MLGNSALLLATIPLGRLSTPDRHQQGGRGRRGPISALLGIRVSLTSAIMLWVIEKIRVDDHPALVPSHGRIGVADDGAFRHGELIVWRLLGRFLMGVLLGPIFRQVAVQKMLPEALAHGESRGGRHRQHGHGGTDDNNDGFPVYSDHD